MPAGRVNLKIDGMTCQMCVGRIQKALEALDGVVSAEVVLEPGSAVVVGTASVAALIEAVENTGKSASLTVSHPVAATEPAAGGC